MIITAIIFGANQGLTIDLLVKYYTLDVTTFWLTIGLTALLPTFIIGILMIGINIRYPSNVIASITCIPLLLCVFSLGRASVYLVSALLAVGCIYANEGLAEDCWGFGESFIHTVLISSWADGLQSAPQLIFQGYLLAKELSDFSTESDS